MNIGDSVIMNKKYVVKKKTREGKFTVRSQNFDICGTECVMLEGYSGGYAVGWTYCGRKAYIRARSCCPVIPLN